jgi:hypothetical protein
MREYPQGDNMNSIISNTTKGRCMNDAGVLIEANISFRFEYIAGSYVIFVADADSVRASQAIKTARDSY